MVMEVIKKGGTVWSWKLSKKVVQYGHGSYQKRWYSMVMEVIKKGGTVRLSEACKF